MSLSSTKDMTILQEIEDLVEDIKLKSNKALSLIRLHVDREEAFSGVLECVRTVSQKIDGIEDPMIKEIAVSKINYCKDYLEQKIFQSKHI